VAKDNTTKNADNRVVAKEGTKMQGEEKGIRTTLSSGLGPPAPSPPMMRCITSLAMVMNAISTLMFDFADVSKNLT
jgi:hypothetical protein